MKKNQEQQKSNLIKAQDRFGFKHDPDAYIISVHIRNMMATFGEERTLFMIKELFFTGASKKGTDKKVSGLGQ
jgi:hypothetical protein